MSVDFIDLHMHVYASCSCLLSKVMNMTISMLIHTAGYGLAADFTKFTQLLSTVEQECMLCGRTAINEASFGASHVSSYHHHPETT